MSEPRCIECGETETGMYPVRLDEPDGFTNYVCHTCVDLSSGPGRFEAVPRDKLASAVAAYTAVMNGFSDATLFIGDGDVDGSSIDLVGRFILHHDSQGFVSAEEYPSVAEARAAFAALEAELELAEADEYGCRLGEAGTLPTGSALGDADTLGGVR